MYNVLVQVEGEHATQFNHYSEALPLEDVSDPLQRERIPLEISGTCYIREFNEASNREPSAEALNYQQILTLESNELSDCLAKHQATTTQSSNPAASDSPSGLPFRCDRSDCRTSFQSLGLLRSHNESAHNRRYHCPDLDCTKSFTERRSLKRHTNDRKYFCPWGRCIYARWGFARRDFLQKHIRRKH